ncbi:MORN repeat variant [Providencia rustigianii]|uniref:MORN repeat protein n=2 Tax=Providencia rustigianii TaxID=158850 RepID=D1P0F0_9GAMM|nr:MULTISPECIES: hypothetical protein [Providencia]EFB73148.1 MORN repeat protein [Providencia rustigianii DSM 4541]MTC56756.1 hypothetical protein [Providencia rustigianii]MTC60483.1 hypothetical protein [Providencia rustigianii]SPY75985.1 MORN repeat variant [Providencia rustigianii]SUC25111.1 MORN repeat variant [Providencia rustigianii]
MKIINIAIVFSVTLALSGCLSQPASQGDNGVPLEEFKELENLRMPELNIPEGAPDGEYVERYPNGNIQFKSWVKNNCLDKNIYTYYENGKLNMHIPVKNCKVDGVIKSYLENGNLDTEMGYSNDRLNGDYKSYYDTPKNNLHIKASFVNGSVEGALEERDQNGELSKLGYVKDGKLYSAN